MAAFSNGEQRLESASCSEVDQVNAEFYGRFPYPWRPHRLECLEDTQFHRMMLCQGFGDWKHQSVPPLSNIWVAGCGTNQAVITALNFPDAKVLGSDLSVSSLELSRRTAGELSIKNLELRQESLNLVQYKDQFDYIICTGVIHHNADPAEPLRRISNALQPGGILELMVYNRFHRTLPSSVQRAIRMLAGSERTPGSAVEVELVSALISAFHRDGQMKQYLQSFEQSPPALLADALMQPLEHSYTVEDLHALAASCNLEMLLPCISIFDKLNGNVSWNLNFNSQTINERYGSLGDVQRWQVTNLLLCERSPMLWFYFRRADSRIRRRCERDVCQDFLATVFEKAVTKKHSYILGEQDRYEPAGISGYPALPGDRTIAKLVTAADGAKPMWKVLEELGEPNQFERVNELRLRLTTPAFPYLKAVGSADHAVDASREIAGTP